MTDNQFHRDERHEKMNQFICVILDSLAFSKLSKHTTCFAVLFMHLPWVPDNKSYHCFGNWPLPNQGVQKNKGKIPDRLTSVPGISNHY